MGTAIPFVRPWPAAQQAAVTDLAENGLAVIGITYDTGRTREFARRQIRVALVETLAVACHCPPSQIRLLSQPAQPVQVLIPGRQMSLSISHESGLSVAVICGGGVAGIDIVRVDETLDWKPVAELYLGAEIACAIGRRPVHDQARCFALKWAEQEARLKCRGLAISEWSAGLARELAQCRAIPLDLPATYAGSLAIQDSPSAGE